MKEQEEITINSYLTEDLEKELLSSEFPYASFISVDRLSKEDKEFWIAIDGGALPTKEQFEEYKEKALKNNPTEATLYFVDYLANKLTPYFLKEQYRNLKKAS